MLACAASIKTIDDWPERRRIPTAFKACVIARTPLYEANANPNVFAQKPGGREESKTYTSSFFVRSPRTLAAGGPCIIEPPNQVKKEEPKAGTSGLQGRKSSTLNPHIIEQKHWTSNRNSRNPILTGFNVGGLVFVDCPWCDRFHVHSGGRQDSARVIGKEGQANGN
jgi:hypothetical protein